MYTYGQVLLLFLLHLKNLTFSLLEGSK